METYSKHKELKKSNLTEYCLIGTLLQSYKRNIVFFVSVKNDISFLKKKPFCDFCLFYRDIEMFSYDLFNLDKFSHIPKLFRNFVLFYRILNY